MPSNIVGAWSQTRWLDDGEMLDVSDGRKLPLKVVDQAGYNEMWNSLSSAERERAANLKVPLLQSNGYRSIVTDDRVACVGIGDRRIPVERRSG